MPVNRDSEYSDELPPELQGWNWGAFILTWIWGIFNGTFISLLCLIPGIHLIVMFILGLKGNEWAWKNRNWQSTEHFVSVQRRWAAGAFVVCIAAGFLLVAIPLGIWLWGVKTEMPGIKAMVNNFEFHDRFVNYALEEAGRNSRCSSYLGAPLQLSGSPQYVYNRNGRHELAVPVRGTRGQGVVYLRARGSSNKEAELERAEIELQNLKRVQLDPRIRKQEILSTEQKIISLQSAIRKENRWNKREPNGRAEAEEFYKESLKKIEKEPAVRKALGSKITAKLEEANVNIQGPVGEAKFVVVLNGKSETGLLNLQGSRSMGRWTATEAQLQVRGEVLRIPSSEVAP